MIFESGLFTIDPNATPDQIARKREMIAAMMPRFGDARYVGQGIGQLLTGVATGKQNRALNRAEREGREGASERFNALFGGGEASAPRATGSTMGAAPAAVPTGPEAEALRQGLIDRGMAPHVADAFVLNAADESGLNPGINEASPLVPGSRGGFGLFQWTGPRREQLEAYAASRGASADDQNIQMDFLMRELQGSEAGAANSILGAPDTPTAAAAIVNDFLRPAEEHRANRTARYLGLEGGGYNGPPVEALYAALSDPWMSPEQKAAIAQMLDQAQQANDPMRRLQLAQGAAELEQTMNPALSGPAELGLTPQYGVDANGNPVLIQIGKDGRAVQTAMPEGVTLSRDPIKLDAGTHFVLLDPITRQPVGTIPKDTRGAAAETAAGKVEGEAAASAAVTAPNAIAKADTSIALIDQILNDPNLDSITGMIQGRLPPMTQGGTDLNVKIEQLQGRVFLEAFESLKGGGQITEREGQAAQAAMARLQRAQSTEEYRAALQELRGIIETAKARLQASGNAPAAAQPTTRLIFNPETGELEPVQ